jgi:hypothetical protein
VCATEREWYAHQQKQTMVLYLQKEKIGRDHDYLGLEVAPSPNDDPSKENNRGEIQKRH